jgi:PAS domain S-box-containing protein
MARPNEAVSAIFAAKGEIAALMRAFDWSKTSLGDPENWPQSLRSVLSICLNTRYPICIFWGQEHIMLYNDAYSSILGRKHPWALGHTVREVWPEIWDLIGARFARVIGSGEAIWAEDELLPMHRHGYTEECYFNFTFSPVRGEGDAVVGIFNAVIETSGRVISERRTRLLCKLAEETAGARSAQDVCLRAASLLAGAEDVPFCLIYQLHSEAGAWHAQLTAAAGIAAGSPASPEAIALEGIGAPGNSWPLLRVLKSGGLEIVDDLSARFGVAFPGGAWPEDARSAVIIPIRLSGADETPIGFLILGINPRQAFNEEYSSFVELAAGSLRDGIARMHASDEERRQAEEHWAIVDFALNRAHEGAFLINRDSRFLYVNDEAVRSLGYSREELLTMCVPDIDPDFPAARWARHLEEMWKEGSRTFESRHRAKDGRIFPVEINSNYFKYGGSLYSMALVRDITERKRAEEQLQAVAKQQAVLDFALNRVHEGAFLLDAGARFLYVNDEAIRSGLQPGGVVANVCSGH